MVKPTRRGGTPLAENTVSFRPTVKQWKGILATKPPYERSKLVRHAWGMFVQAFPDPQAGLLHILAELPTNEPLVTPFQLLLGPDLYPALTSYPRQLRSTALRYALTWYEENKDRPHQLVLADLPEAASC